MKLFIFILCLLAGSFSLAEVSNEITKMNLVKFDGKNFDFSYTASGGCEVHRAEVQVELVKKSEFAYLANIKVYDVTDEDDECESLVDVAGTVDLKQMVKDQALKQSLGGVIYFEVSLPKVVVN
jgi:hypothetical protein